MSGGVEVAYEWQQKLQGCREVKAVSQTLCDAILALTGQEVVGVFLLDYTGSNLVLVAEKKKGTVTEPVRDNLISVDNNHDPLCFSLQIGRTYEAEMGKFESSPSLTALTGTDMSGISFVGAVPLKGLQHVTVGGVVVAGGVRFSLDALISLLCGSGGVIISSLAQKNIDWQNLKSMQTDIKRLEKKQARLPSEHVVVGKSPAIQKVRSLIAKAAGSHAIVLITGATGTGKELVASAIHAASDRSAGPFLKLNCAALPAALLESELFGHKKGAFSGADSESLGLLRQADGGTVLLDEIGDMSMELQAKLLRVLQDAKVRPVGEVVEYPIDVRFLAATNVNLKNAMESGTFRPDLFYRLNVLTIPLPSLAERPEDIPLLAEFILKKLREEYNRPLARFAPETLELLIARPYPGNVRELWALIHKTLILADETTTLLTPDLFLEKVRTAKEKTLADMVGAYEAMLIMGSLQRCRWNVSDAAKLLGLPRSTLRSKIRKLPQESLNANRFGVVHGYHI